MDKNNVKNVLNRYILGDMLAIYYLAETAGNVELLLIPKDMEDKIAETKGSNGNSLVQVKLLGDDYPGSYAGGLTMQGSQTAEDFFSYDYQETKEDAQGFVTSIHTHLKDERGYEIVHTLNWHKGDFSVDTSATFINHSGHKVALELLTSFCLGEITPFQKGEATHSLFLHRIRSKWSQEGRLVKESIEQLQLEPSWAKAQPHCERYGQVGSMPVKKYFPFIGVEDASCDVFWGAQLALECSWQMEVYRRDDALTISGGLSDREFGHWMKEVLPGEAFTTPYAILSVCRGTIDQLCQRLVQYTNKFTEKGPECEQSLPVLFNEYCTTWGLPSHENIAGIVDAVKNRGIAYFVIDCGWFVEEGKHWGVSMGDYVPSDKLFPEGLSKTTQLIKDNGMKPGIWFEIDNVGKLSHAYEDEAHLLKRDGYVLTTGNRRFWNMKDAWVKDHLTSLVIGQLKKYGFEYMKMDYNDTIGLGCDGAESLGEGLRQNMEASVDFVRKVKEEIPGIILENCASGGHKLEPLMMSICSMASFSDAHECEEIPVIAGCLHRSILPRQSQIWAVIRKEDSLKRTAYILASTFLGRMCLSGDVTQLKEEQWRVIDNAIAFYHKASPVIKNGFSYFYGEKKPSDRHLEGWQAILRVQCEENLQEQGLPIYGGIHDHALLTLHTFRGDLPEYIEIPLPQGCPEEIEAVYSDTDIQVSVENHVLRYKTDDEMKGLGILLK